MPEAPFPPTEGRRLAAVQKLRMMGTPAEERFDKITRLAKRVFNVSMAVIDIVGETRAWIKSVQGGTHTEVARPVSYCHYTVLRDEVCLVEDARVDPRFHDNPYAEVFPFYAGVPIQFEGENVGVFCICDGDPRILNEEEKELLHDMAALVEHELHVTKLSETQLALARENEELETKALVDGLTRAWNRAAILEILTRELESGRTNERPTAVLMLDIDHFKQVNDTYGHPAGDEVLRRVADRLRRSVRSFDAVGRMGGEEFLVVLPSCTEEDLPVVAERVRASVADGPVTFEGKEILVTASLGATVSLDGTHFANVLVKAADDGLYRAKRNGRNQCCIRFVSESLLNLKAVR